MNPLLLLGLIGVSALVLSKPAKKVKVAAAPAYLGMTPAGELITITGQVLKPPISTLDLVRITARYISRLPTPFYPANVERFNGAVADFNEGRIDERALRYVVWDSLLLYFVIGGSPGAREQHEPIDLVAHLEAAKRGDFIPDVVIKGGAKKGRYKRWEYFGKDKDAYIAEYWPYYLGGGKGILYSAEVPGPSAGWFVLQLVVALVADPTMTLFADVRQRSASMLRAFVQAMRTPACGGTYDGHDYDKILVRNDRWLCVQTRTVGNQLWAETLHAWRDDHHLTLPKPAWQQVEQVAELGSEAAQLDLIVRLVDPFKHLIVRKTVVWPGGPAARPYVDWGWIALFYIKTIGVAAAAALTGGAALVGLYSLALEAEEKAAEWQKGEVEAGRPVTIEELAAAGYGVAEVASQ